MTEHPDGSMDSIAGDVMVWTRPVMNWEGAFSRMTVEAIGLDIAKHVFQVHGADGRLFHSESKIISSKYRWGRVLSLRRG